MGAQQKPWPDFYLVGAAKCATSSVASGLASHEDIVFSTPKEPNFFSTPAGGYPLNGALEPKALQTMLYSQATTDEASYLDLFKDVPAGKTSGEGSVRYLYFREAAPRIHAVRPDARILIMLRDPVDRMFSHYGMNRQYHMEPLPFEAALDAEQERIGKGWVWDYHYQAVSSYAAQVEHYLNVFGPDQVAVFFFEDLKADRGAVMRALCDHIGVDGAKLADDNIHVKPTRAHKNQAIDRFLHVPGGPRDLVKKALEGLRLDGVAKSFRRRIDAANTAPREELDPALRAHLQERFAADQDKLEALLGRKLPWKRAQAS